MPERWNKVKCPKCNTQINQLMFTGGVFNMWNYNGKPYWTYDAEDDIPCIESFEEPPDNREEYRDGFDCPHCLNRIADTEKEAIQFLSAITKEKEQLFLRTGYITSAIPGWLQQEVLERVKKLHPDKDVEEIARNTNNWIRTKKYAEDGGFIAREFCCKPLDRDLRLFVRTDKRGRLEFRLFMAKRASEASS